MLAFESLWNRKNVNNLSVTFSVREMEAAWKSELECPDWAWFTSSPLWAQFRSLEQLCRKDLTVVNTFKRNCTFMSRLQFLINTFNCHMTVVDVVDVYMSFSFIHSFSAFSRYFYPKQLTVIINHDFLKHKSLTLRALLRGLI